MLNDAFESLRDVVSPRFRSVLWRSLALTLVLLVLVWIGLDRLLLSFLSVPYPWLATAIAFATGIGLFVCLAFLVAPASSLVAGLFLDELAEEVERSIGPAHQVGRALPAGAALWIAIRFAGLSALVNFVALALLLVPGVNLIAFFVANAYLFGREYFELAALRYRSSDEAAELRRAHSVYLFGCGLVMAAFVAIPVVNLLTPLFATAFMVRVHRRITPAPGWVGPSGAQPAG